jgi:hypothetical protein
MGGGGHRHPGYRSCVLARTGGVRESFRRWIGPFDDWGVALDEAIDDREEALEAVGLRK